MNDFDYNLIKKYVPKEEQEQAIIKLKSGYPIQYIIGNVDFYNSLIEVNENVLIPRFETEYLVERTLKLMKEDNFIQPNILDIGSGSGAIAIALKKAYACQMDAIDISKDAIALAQKNALNNGVDVNFEQMRIEDFNPPKKYDIVISNPPYIPFDGDVDEKTKYEPKIALYAPEDGLYFYRIILEKAQIFLNKHNLMAFEIGFDQASRVKQLILNYFPNAKVICENDLNGYNRYVYAINE